MMDREYLAKEVFIADNGRLTRDAAEKEWAESTPAHPIYAYAIAIADRMAQLIAEQVQAAAQATLEAYVEAYPGFRDGWGADPESRGARDIARRTTQWLRDRANNRRLIARKEHANTRV